MGVMSAHINTADVFQLLRPMSIWKALFIHRRICNEELVNLAEKILVTGASTGIGAETAVLCSQLGAKVVLVARREDKQQEVMMKLKSDGHRYFAFDLSYVDEIEGFIKSLISEVGP